MQMPPPLEAITARLTTAGSRGWWALRRSRTARRALLGRAVAVAAVVAVVVSTRHDLHTATALRERWEQERTVLVTTRAVGLGEAIDERNTELQVRPAGHVPDGALGRRPVRQHATSELSRGEILTETRVADRAGGVPAGRAAVAVSVQSPAPRLGRGDHVQLLAVASPPAPDDPGTEPLSARVVTDDAMALGSPEETDASLTTLTVAVPQRDVAEVAGAALAGPLAVVVPADEP
jgi:Flp pilus assembly protein CpaB